MVSQTLTADSLMRFILLRQSDFRPMMDNTKIHTLIINATRSKMCKKEYLIELSQVLFKFTRSLGMINWKYLHFRLKVNNLAFIWHFLEYILQVKIKLLQEILIMSNIKINLIPALTPTSLSSSGYSGSSGNKGDNKGSCSGQTFQDIFKQMLEGDCK